MKNVIIRNADHNQTAVYFDVDKLYRMDNGALFFEHNQSLSLVKPLVKRITLSPAIRWEVEEL